MRRISVDSVRNAYRGSDDYTLRYVLIAYFLEDAELQGSKVARRASQSYLTNVDI